MEHDNSNPNKNNHSELKSLIENHKKNKDPNDTESVWFSAAEVKKLLEQDHVNGIRVYFARHHGTHLQHPNRKTVVLLPTTDQTNPQGPTPENSKDIVNSDSPIAANFQVPGSGGGTLCPPRC